MDKNEFKALLAKVSTDESAIEQLYTFYYPKTVQCLSFKYGRVIAEDAVQEFFMQLISKKFKKLDVDNPDGWVYRCCENIVKSKLEKEGRHTLIEFDPLNEHELHLDDDDRLLRDKLETLTPEERELLYKIYWLGYSQNEIAEETGEKPGTIRQRHLRIVKKLK